MADLILPARWYRLRHHEQQVAYARSSHRFNVVPAGRRSGKTERAKRKLVYKGLEGTSHFVPRFFAAAPTREQAKRIYWSDLKAMTEPFWAGAPSEVELTLRVRIGGAHYRDYSEIVVLGMDKPERIEGSPWDGGVLDEYANMKEHAWGAHVEPALADREGWCDLIGVPEGRNHYYKRYNEAVAMMQEHGRDSDWAAFTWKSADILPAKIIEAARRNLDPLLFEQEYEASFVNFEGRVYYCFDDAAKRKLTYDPFQPLIVCLDFNVAPGVAVIAQEQTLPNGQQGTGVIGEVWIENNSNTRAVCRKIIADWGKHEGQVKVYGDATGGARGTAQTEGSDWDIVRTMLRAQFKDRVLMRVKPSNPTERARVNAVNSRLQSASDVRRMFVDPARAPHLIEDFEGVRYLKGGAGEIDKKIDPKLTHPSDALGYYVEYEFPVTPRATQSKFKVV